MGFLDDAKNKLTDAVDKSGHTIGGGLDKAADLLDKKTGGKHSSAIDGAVARTKGALDGLDGQKDGDIK